MFSFKPNKYLNQVGVQQQIAEHQQKIHSVERRQAKLVFDDDESFSNSLGWPAWLHTQYNVELPQDFYIMNVKELIANHTLYFYHCILAIRWCNPCSVVHRYQIGGENKPKVGNPLFEWVPFPVYSNQKVSKNCIFEIWRLPHEDERFEWYPFEVITSLLTLPSNAIDAKQKLYRLNEQPLVYLPEESLFINSQEPMDLPLVFPPEGPTEYCCQP